jgi:hypothetical protein
MDGSRSREAMCEMISKMIFITVVVALLYGTLAAQDQSQNPPLTVVKIQQVLHEAQEEHKAVKVILRKTVENRKTVGGKVIDISDTCFVVNDQKAGTATNLAYKDVHEIHKKGRSKTATMAIYVLAGGVITAVVAGDSMGGGEKMTLIEPASEPSDRERSH